jgi:DNA-binding MurR/RpiR family transcriptional regulator
MLRTTSPLTSAHYASFLPNVGKFDGCIDFDIRRYQRDVLKLTMQAHTSEAKIILVITGPWFSQAAEVADLVLPVTG